MNHIKTLFFTLILLSTSGLAFVIYRQESQKRILKEDLIELSKVKYGLFSVDEWKKILSNLISKKIEELNFDGANKEEMRKKISEFLYKAIDEFEQTFNKEQSGSLLGFIKRTAASYMGAFDDIREKVPKMTEQVIAFMNDPENRKRMKGFIIKKMNEYTDKTFSKIDYSAHDEIISRYSYGDREATIPGLTAEIKTLDEKSFVPKISMAVIIFAAIAGIMFSKVLSTTDRLLFIFTSFSLLAFGVLLPMIEIDARISSMSFTLLGEPVSFSDQVLYYKSKSILEVVQLMLNQGRYDVLLVGVLVLLFSVLFPVSKLIASIIYSVSEKTRSNKFINFLVFKTGKWSMADVMVVAIFMAYIGFSGIVTEQLKQLEGITTNLDILTTNESSLQSGFFLFTAFTILSLLVAGKLGSQSYGMSSRA